MTALAFLATVGMAWTARGAVTATPATVSVFPTQTSPAITLTLMIPGSVGASGTATLQFTGLPTGVTTVPSPVNYAYATGVNSYAVSLQLAVGAPVVPGTYLVTVTDPVVQIPAAVVKASAGSTVVTLVVRAPSFTALALPNPVPLTILGSSQTVTVTTTSDPGFAEPSLVYSFTGLPGFINSGGSRTTSAPGYATVTFTFSLGAGATAGTYAGTLVGSNAVGLPLKSFPFSVVVSPAPPPTLISIVPGTIQQGASGQFTLTGTGFVTGATVTISGADVTVAATTVVSATQILFSATASGTATPGVRNVTVTNPDAQQSNPVVLQVTRRPAPSITSITPTSIEQGAPGQFTLTGTGFVTGATVTISGGDVTVGTTTVVSATQILFSATAANTAALGVRNVVVTNPDQQQSNAGTLQVIARPAPTIYALAPTTLQQGTSGQFTLTGNGFATGATVTVSGGVSVGQTTVASSTQILFNATASDNATVGPRTVMVTNPDGQQSNAAPLQVVLRPAPTLTSISPGSLLQGAASQLVTVSGGNFLGGAAVTVTPAAGVTVGAVNVVSPSMLQFVTSVDPEATSGARSVVVTNRDGQASNAVVLQITPRLPMIASVSPPALVVGAFHVVLNVAGDNFREGVTATSRTSSLTVESITRISRTLAKVQVSVRNEPAAIGPAAIELHNPDGGVSVPPGQVLVYPSDSLGAPLSVTAAAITFPLEGTFVGPEEALYPRGLLATSGTGTIVGSWRLDGVPYDRFVVPTAGGLPVKVPSSVPVPTAFTGSHTLELAVENPETQVVAAVTVIRAERKASDLRIYAPPEGTVVGAPPPLFRWSLVPGAFGYEVEIERGLPELPLFFPVVAAEWRPTAGQIAEIGPGLRRWRVRPVLAGGVRGEPTEMRRIAVLPERVQLSLLKPDQGGPGNRFRIRWTGGAPGVIYKVELFAVGGPETPRFSALTADQEYVLPTPLIGGWAFRVRVTAYGPGGKVLGRSETGSGPGSGSAGGMFPDGLILAAAPPSVTGVAPAEGETVKSMQPVISARWSGDVKHGEVLLFVDDTDMTPVSTIGPASITYEALLPLDPGRHTVRLSLAGQVTAWSFIVALETQAAQPQAPGAPAKPGAAPAPPETKPEKAPGEVRGNWQIGLQGGITYVKEDPKSQPNNVLAQLSAQGDLSDGSLSAKGAGDVAISHALEAPNKTVQQSRNWLVNLGAEQGSFKQQLAVGYAAPSFVAGSELMTTGVARGGAELLLATPGPVASVYYSPSNKPVGVVAGSFGPEQRITAAALSTPQSLQNVQISAIGLKTEDSPGFNSAGGEGRLYGVFGRVAASAVFNIIFEAARGTFTPNPGSTESEQKGNAFRLGLTGTRGTFSYALNLRRTEAGFVNPANRGFTVGSVADRQGGDLTMQKAVGRTVISLQIRHLDGGNTSGAASPSARENGGVVQLSTAFSQKVTFQLGGNLTTNTGDADTVHQLPRTDNRAWGAMATLSEMLGTFAVSQAFTYQDMQNKVMPDADMKMAGATFTGGGQIVQTFGLFGTFGFTRMDGSAPVGRTDQTLLTVQPNWAIPSLGLTLQPRAAWNQSKSSLTSTETRTEQYQLAVTWNPPAIGTYASLQLTGDWNRSEVSGQPGQGFHRRLGLVVNIQWGGSSQGPGSGPIPPMAPPPGTGTPVPSAANLIPPLGVQAFRGR
jgi:hypothetical protein